MHMLVALLLLATLDGKWAGEAGPPEDRVPIAFEFRDHKAYLYQRVINFYGLELPGEVKATDTTLEVPSYALSTKLEGDALQGTYGLLRYPITLRRTDSLPAEVPIPDLPKGPGPLWQIKLFAPIYAPAATRDSIAYIGTAGGVFHAVKIDDGSIVWTFSAGRPIFGQAAVDNDAVYFVCDNGYLFKLDRKSGKELWRYDLGDARVSRVLPHQTVYEWDFKAPRPVIADGVLYIGSGDGSFHAVRVANGQRVWRFEPPRTTSKVSVGGTDVEAAGKIRTEAAIDGARVIFGSFDGNIYALDRATGKLVWKRDTKARVDSSIVVTDNKVLIGNWGGLSAALNANDGSVIWRRFWWGSAVESTPTVFGDRAYIGASDLRRITSFDPKDGRVHWRTDVYGWAWGRPVVTAKSIYIGVAAGSPYDMRHVASMTELDRETGTIRWRYPVPESGFTWGFAASPAIDGNRIIIGAIDGTLYAFPAL